MLSERDHVRVNGQGVWYYLTLLPEGAGQREHSLREVFNGLRYIFKTGAPWRWMPNDFPPWAAMYRKRCSATLALAG